MRAFLWLIRSLVVIFGAAPTDPGPGSEATGTWDPNGSEAGGTWDPNG
jgi:hypothetical protein